MKALVDRLVVQRLWVLFVAAALVFAGLTIVGTYNNYSPVPFWDMWNGYLEFYMRSGEGWGPWWELHNEHRLVVPKTIFWLELTLFNGSLIALFTLNVLLALAVFACFLGIFSRLVPDWRRTPAALALVGLLGVLSFSWLQADNFTWAFQSQFFLAYLLPLLSFSVLAMARSRQSTRLFMLALLLGVLSAGTMANGVIALPVMVVLALVLGLGWVRTLSVAVVAAVVLTCYFSNYHTPAGHGSILEVLRTEPLGVLEYVLLYLGSPLFFMLDGDSFLMPKLAGGFLVASAAYFTLRGLFGEEAKPQQWALLAFLLFVGGTAMGTASGRLTLGLDQALTSRYITPVLMAWSALLVLYFSYVGRRMLGSLWGLGIFAVLVGLLVPFQLRTLERPPVMLERTVAGLALELGARDAEYIAKVYFDMERALAISAQARPQHLSIFAYPSIAGASQRLGETLEALPEARCNGSFDLAIPLPEERAFVRVEGWLYQQQAMLTPQTVLLLDGERKVVGYALTGRQRPDVAAAIAPQAEYAGFLGYQRSDTEAIFLVGQNPACVYQTR